MEERLLKMLVREQQDFTDILSDPTAYNTLQATKSRMKRDGKGEWQTSYGGFKGDKKLTVKRIA